MAQYKTGTANVTNLSANVVGVGTEWLANVTPGVDTFTVEGTGVTYDIASVTSDTALALSAPYGGDTASGVTYAITRDFTSPDNFPLLYPGDIETPTIFSRLANKAQDAITAIVNGTKALTNANITGGSVAVSTLGIDGAIGNLTTPLADIMRGNRFTSEHVGSLTVTSPAGTMYPDRYGVLQASSSGVGRFGKDGFICSPSATNNLLHSDATVTDTAVSAGVTNAGSFPQFTNGLQFPATATNESAYKSFATVASTAYVCSAFVVMDDSSAPVPGLSTDGSADFYLVIDGTEVAAADYTVEVINASQALYRVGARLTSAAASANVGAARASTQSGKGFRVTGYQLQTGIVATDYIPTTTAGVTVGAAYLALPAINNIPNGGESFSIKVAFVWNGDTSGAERVYYLAGLSSTFIHSTLFAAASSTSNLVGVSPAAAGSALTAGQVREQVITYDGDTNTLTVYNDGIQGNQSTPGGDFVFDSAKSIAIGAADAGGAVLNGAIREFKIYDRALTADEVRIG